MLFSFLTRRSKSKTASVEIEVDERSTPNEGSSHDEKSRPAMTGSPVPLILPPSRHSLDPNLLDSFPIQSMTSRTAISPDLDPEKDLEIPIDISLNSPYPQVRAAVRNTGRYLFIQSSFTLELGGNGVERSKAGFESRSACYSLKLKVESDAKA